MAARLKVFTWSDGFHAFTVAASSRLKALEAWGMASDIFKTGLASEATDGLDKTAALASPGAVITRGLAVDVGETKAKAAWKRSAATEKAKTKVADLEAKLATLEAEQVEAMQDVEDRLTALMAEQDALDRDQAKAKDALKARLKAARAALR